jgi:agmatine deiminase
MQVPTPPATSSVLLPGRRRWLAAAAGLVLTGGAGVGRASVGEGSLADARITADFEPLAAMWLGYDPGHAPFTAALAQALHPHVPLKLLVRDALAEAQAAALLAQHAVPADRVQFVQHPQALFFVRDAAVFGLDGLGGLAVVDFRWSHYGWGTWCQRRYGAGSAAQVCADADASVPDALDRDLAELSDASVFRSALAMEGGGVEVNGQGLLIANETLWLGRNPGRSRASIEQDLLRLPGVRKVIWLPEGLAQDPLHRATIVGRHVAWGTGGHTDEFVRFADAQTVLLAWPDRREAARHPVTRLNQRRMQRNFDILKAATDVHGRPLRVLKVPLPRIIERRVVLSASADAALSREWTAESFPRAERRREGDWVMQVASASYLNFVVANGVVLLPDYLPHGTPRPVQDQVQEAMEAAFPGRAIRWVDAGEANWLGGGAHCASLSEPVART